MKKIAPALLAVALLGGGAGFYGGMAYAKGKTAPRGDFAREGGMMGAGGFPAGMPGGMNGGRQGGTARVMGGGFTAGEIIAKDETSLTVKLMDGGSKIVFLSAETKISKAADGTVEDLKVGEQVVVMGSAGSDGSVTATSVQLGGGVGMRPTGDRPFPPAGSTP